MSLHKEFQAILKTASTTESSSSYSLRSSEERKRKRQFDEKEEIPRWVLRDIRKMKNEEKGKKDGREKNDDERMKKKAEKKRKLLVAKIQEKLKVRKRYEKRMKLEIDIESDDDALIWSWLFDITPGDFHNHVKSPQQHLKHHVREVVWMREYTSGSDLESRLGTGFYQCNTKRNAVILLLNLGTQDGIEPFRIRLVRHIINSYVSDDVLGQSIVQSETYIHLNLEVSFRAMLLQKEDIDQDLQKVFSNIKI